MSRSLHDAVNSGSLAEVTVRINMGEDINSTFPPGYQTALHRAVLCDNEEILRLLLSRGAEPNIGDKEGLTPLALAKSTNKRSLVTILQSAGGSMSAASTHVTEVDLKHDPMFSHPPPWAAVEKIYAAVVHKHETPDASIFNVPKFDFKMFDGKKKNETQPSQPQNYTATAQLVTQPMQQKQPQPKSPKQSTPKNENKSFFNIKSNQEKNVNETMSVSVKNEVKDSVKFTINTASDPLKKKTEDNTENIYDVPTSCDIVQVEESQEIIKTENNFLEKIKVSSGKISSNIQDKSQKLNNRISGVWPKNKSDAAKKLTNKGDGASLYSRFVSKMKKENSAKENDSEVKNSSVKQNDDKSSNVKKVSFPKFDKSIKGIREKLSIKKGENPKKISEPAKTLKITKSNNTEIYTAAPVDDKINLGEIKQSVSGYFRSKKASFPTLDKIKTKKSNRVKDPISSSESKLQSFKSRVSSIRGNLKTNDGNTNSQKKKTTFNLFSKEKKSDNIDTESKKVFGFKFQEKWAKVKKQKECTTVSDTKLKSFKSTTKAATEKKARFSEEQKNFSFHASNSTNYNSNPKPFDTKCNSHNYRWNFVDGQWRKSDSLGL